jgi:hypothetical protein
LPRDEEEIPFWLTGGKPCNFACGRMVSTPTN